MTSPFLNWLGRAGRMEVGEVMMIATKYKQLLTPRLQLRRHWPERVYRLKYLPDGRIKLTRKQ